MRQKISKKMYPVYWRPWAAHHCWRKEHESPSRRAPAKLAASKIKREGREFPRQARDRYRALLLCIYKP